MKLHEKKISELVPDEVNMKFDGTVGEVIKQISGISLDDLKQWAIAVVKDKTANMGFGTSPEITAFLKDRFEITEEDLK